MHARLRTASLVAVALLLFITSAQAALAIRDYESRINDRFYDDPTDRAFIGEAYDWSGVGRADGGTWVTMISPSYFLTADHFPAAGTVTFYPGNDNTVPPLTYLVESTTRVGLTDIRVGKLTTPVSSSIARYPVLTTGLSEYIGREMYVYGRQERVGKNILDSISVLSFQGRTTATAWYDYDEIGSAIPGEARLQPGDSGGPSFIVYGETLSVVGVHWVTTVGDTPPILSGDSFVPAYADAVQSLMGTEELLVNPEPSTFVLFFAGGALVAGWAWRRKRKAA